MSKRETVVDIFIQNPDFTQRKIAKIAGTSFATAKRAIRNYQLNISNESKPIPGRPKGIINKILDRKVCKGIERKRSKSTRDLARLCKTSQAMIQRIKARCGFKTYTKQNVAKKTPKQFNEGIDRAKNLNRLLSGKKNDCLIMDDETYVKLDFSTLPGKQFYNKKSGEILPAHITTYAEEKFPAKRMVWQAICECGLRSQPFVTSGTMDAKIYIAECLQKRLLPFIEKHRVPCIFWPDLAPIHYSRTTLQWFDDNNITFVPKTANPAAVPEDRPIETYWAQCKRELKNEPKGAKDDKEFKYRWGRASSRVTKETIKSMMAKVREKVKLRSRMTKINMFEQ
jgi:hypothetical protein